MGLYFSAEPWFASTGAAASACGRGSEARALLARGAAGRSRGRGLEMTVPKGAKASAVRGSGVSRSEGGGEMRVGAGIYSAVIAHEWRSEATAGVRLIIER